MIAINLWFKSINRQKLSNTKSQNWNEKLMVMNQRGLPHAPWLLHITICGSQMQLWDCKYTSVTSIQNFRRRDFSPTLNQNTRTTFTTQIRTLRCNLAMDPTKISMVSLIEQSLSHGPPIGFHFVHNITVSSLTTTTQPTKNSTKLNRS